MVQNAGSTTVVVWQG